MISYLKNLQSDAILQVWAIHLQSLAMKVKSVINERKNRKYSYYTGKVQSPTDILSFLPEQ